VVGDAAPEGNETAFVRLLSPYQTVISDSSATS